MNLVLLEECELGRPLPKEDHRAKHVLEILGRRVGDTVNAGVVNGPVGMATVTGIEGGAVSLAFAAVRETPPLPKITLVVGLCRPPTARDILRDATTCGVSAIHFVRCQHTDKSYAQSKIWQNDEWRKFVLLGASQAHDTRLPVVSWNHTLGSALAEVASGSRVVLDNFRTTAHLGSWTTITAGGTALFIGPERGWGPKDRALLVEAEAQFFHLGQRALRVEMAVVAALAILGERAT